MSDNERAREQAQAQLACIKEMVAALECDYERLEELRRAKADLIAAVKEAEPGADANAARVNLEIWNQDNAEELEELQEAAGECKDEEEARQRIEEDALSVEIRSGWYYPGEAPEPEEFKILLCTGGPACQIIGGLNQFNEPESAHLMYQDWFTPWEELELDSEDEDALLTYARCFYFGE